MAHDLHCECVEQLKHVRTERERAERKMKKLAAALFETDSWLAQKVVGECNAEGGVMIDDPTQSDGVEIVGEGRGRYGIVPKGRATHPARNDGRDDAGT